MMTVRDLLEQFTIEGALRIQNCVNDNGHFDVYFDTINHDHDLDNRKYEWLDREIEYMYPSTTEDGDGKELPQIVIEISAD